MIAKALANEAGVNFVYKSAAQFVEMYVGVGPRRIRDLFDKAKLSAPCIVFIDEIDAIGARTMQKDPYGKSNEERNATVNQLLVEMDGFDENDQVVVVAATNREKFLDFALVRSGRFDLKVPVNLPNKSERTGILLLKLARTTSSVSQEEAIAFGKNTEGLSGADIESIVNEAIYLAKGLGEQSITNEHLLASQRKISQGLINVQNQMF
jgi:ATP-dependent Zn protease